MKEKILAFKTRVQLLRKKGIKPFGYSGHQMKFNPTISLEKLEAIEDKYRIRFPEDYRLFLLLVGNGGAGPGYGLEDIERAIKYQRMSCPEDILSRAFPYVQAYNYLEDSTLDELEKQLDTGFISEAEFDQSLEYLTAGTLVLCHEGCGHLHRLVVTGPSRGDVWGDSDTSDQGYYPLKVSFYEWYDQWLNKAEQIQKKKWLFWRR